MGDAKTQSESAETLRQFGFSTRTLLWLMALFASGLGAFGILGPFLSLLVLFVWFRLKHFAETRDWQCITEIFVGLFCCLILYGLLIPTGYFHHSTWRIGHQELCKTAIGDWAMAARHHRNRYGMFPEDFETASGKSLSWRVVILPDIHGDEVIKEEGLDSNWDGADLKYPPDFVDNCGADTPTAYYAVTGEKTAWESGAVSPDYERARSYLGGILLIEAPESVFGAWHTANDVPADQAVQLLTRELWPHRGKHWIDYGLLWERSETFHIAFANGEAMRLYRPLRRELAEAIVRYEGPLSPGHRVQLDIAGRPRLNYKICIGMPAYVLVSLTPALAFIRRSWSVL